MLKPRKHPSCAAFFLTGSMTELTISSTQNPKIKRLLALQQKSQERRQAGLFVVEGQRELQHCMEAGYEIESIFVSSELRGENGEFATVLQGTRAVENYQQSTLTSQLFPVTPQVYEKIAYRGSTEGMIAIVRAKHLQLEDLHPLLHLIL